MVKDGSYPATLTGIKRFANSYGERVCFEFTLRGGKVDGNKVMRICSPALTLRSKLADVVRGLLGRELTTDEIHRGIDLEQFIGTECMVLVQQSHGKNGHWHCNVERVFQEQEEAV
jgi:hypothetical protein